MRLNKYIASIQLNLPLIVCLVSIFFIHKYLFHSHNFHPSFHVLFSIATWIIVTAVRVAHQNNTHTAGYIFMLLTTIQMGVLIFMTRPFLLNDKSEKMSILVQFFVYLAIQTIFSVRELHKKSQ